MTKFAEQNLPKPRLNSTTCQLLRHRLCLLLTLLLYLASSSQSLSAQSQHSQIHFQPLGFVSFDTGEYRHAKTGEIENLLSQLQLFPDNTSIILEGHSHSRGSRANDRLAAIRANAVRDRLVNVGVRSELISLRFDVRNFILQGRLLHGVSVYVLPPLETKFSNATVQSKKPLTVQTGSTLKNPFSGAQLSTANSTSPSKDNATREIVLQPNSKNCTEVVINIGSLQVNLEREIAECGYVMGRWKFGTEDELIDWDIPVAYSTTVDNGIIGLLQLVERNYQIRAHIHQLDKSIDFFPSI